MNEIILPHGSIKVIIERLEVSRPTIRKALRGESDTPLSLEIRKTALDIGGVELKDPRFSKKAISDSRG